MSNTNEKLDPFTMMTDMATYTASLTGMKNQLIALGWSKQNAELVVIETIRQGKK